MLRAGLAGIGKIDVPQPVTTTIASPLLDGLTPPNETLHIKRPLATGEYQIVLIELRGHNSRGVALCVLVWSTLPRPHPFN